MTLRFEDAEISDTVAFLVKGAGSNTGVRILTADGKDKEVPPHIIDIDKEQITQLRDFLSKILENADVADA